MKKYVTAKLFIKPQFKNDFKKEAANLITKTRKESGCISYNLFQDVASEDEFLFFEKYINQEALDYHCSLDYLKNFVTTIKDWQSKEMIVEVLDI